VSQPFDLQTCRKIALEHQPAVAAARASLAAAAARAHAVENLHVPSFLARDLPIRRKQAALGVVVAEAGVARAEADALYGVTFSYLAALYAAEQRQVVDNALANLRHLREGVEAALAAGKTNVSKPDLQKVDVYLLSVRGRREEAVQGEQRALSALREALGAGPDQCPLVPAGRRMPRINPPVDCGQVTALALSRRPELVQAANAAQVTGYEVDAQRARLLPNARTFAANSDLHAQPIPPGSYDEQYHPGAVAPEMPAMLTGSRCDRVEQARAYSARAFAVADKTRGLIALEAEQAYLRWREASNKLPLLDRAAVGAKEVFMDVRDKFDKGLGRITVDQWLSAGTLATDLRVEANRARYQQLLALAALERVTAGGFCAGLDGPQPAADTDASGAREGRDGPPGERQRDRSR
jgi:outer membrane protein TolC